MIYLYDINNFKGQIFSAIGMTILLEVAERLELPALQRFLSSSVTYEIDSVIDDLERIDFSTVPFMEELIIDIQIMLEDCSEMAILSRE